MVQWLNSGVIESFYFPLFCLKSFAFSNHWTRRLFLSVSNPALSIIILRMFRVGICDQSARITSWGSWYNNNTSCPISTAHNFSFCQPMPPVIDLLWFCIADKNVLNVLTVLLSLPPAGENQWGAEEQMSGAELVSSTRGDSLPLLFDFHYWHCICGSLL